MNCTHIRQAISARLDGEPLGVGSAALSEAHHVTDFAVVWLLSRPATHQVQLA